MVGEVGFEPTYPKREQIYSLPRLTTSLLTHNYGVTASVLFIASTKSK